MHESLTATPEELLVGGGTWQICHLKPFIAGLAETLTSTSAEHSPNTEHQTSSQEGNGQRILQGPTAEAKPGP